MTRRQTVSRLFAFAVVGFLFASRASAQTSIQLPNVRFIEPSVREFDADDNLHLHIQSDTPYEKLQVRVFWGSKKDLIDRAKNKPPQSCVYYPSFVKPYASSNGEVRFGWQFSYIFLDQKSDDGFGNQTYTVVPEIYSTTQIDDFRLSPRGAKEYFQSGQEIVLIAPPELQSHAAVKVAKAKQSVAVSDASRTKTTTVVAGPEEGCIMIKTKRAPNALVSELLLESCRNSEE